jgi:hypothetical protein
MCSIQTAINPNNFVLLFSSGEWKKTSMVLIEIKIIHYKKSIEND